MTSGKLVRDRIPELISAEGRKPLVSVLRGQELMGALYEKLTEEHGEFLAAGSDGEKLEELADMIEVLIAIAEQHGCKESDLLELVARKRGDRGSFSKGLFYQGDA
ncbi:nucleoside triphosphate pyrophosphohydrolase [Frigidibacter sp. ROC022]|uniref:nucleoside triphosphate pyrophosphohydrolase n=1 Tax=Frigidibacter sp. ROC022 TaxID=2971796 RepID=UPI00215B15DB|nr:nucleoside triphosphate pyrophosphohydrolase [Frigidibacter sp. ROC022]MCR8726688.1 nucleoside triphosphate pyrophosphohydrolase [Frigidibacter sp. ROC022]